MSATEHVHIPGAGWCTFPTDHGDLLDLEIPLADWTCANGHDNPWRTSRCWADCEETIDNQGGR